MKDGGFFREAAPLAAGSALFGAALALFLTPLGVATGGASGIAVTLHVLIGTPVGAVTLLLNLPLLILLLCEEGRRGALRTAAGVIASSAAADALAPLPAATDDRLLAALLGGAMMGCGSALLLSHGFTTGGSDLAGVLWHRRHPRVRVGAAVALIDAAIVIGSAWARGDFSGVIASAAAIAAYSYALERVFGGAAHARVAWVITDRPAPLCRAITQKISRGATVLRGVGGYTGESRTAVLCVTLRTEMIRLKRIVREIDPGAFMIVTDAEEILGEGFPPPGGGKDQSSISPRTG